MKLVLQRVKSSSVVVDNRLISEIQEGLLVFLGVTHEDSEENIDWLVNKLINLRIFEDEKGKMNLSVKDKNYEIMLVSQFTLYADIQKGRRPDFTKSAPAEEAEELYLQFAKALETRYKKPKLGVFGADMKISLLNDGPVTIILEK